MRSISIPRETILTFIWFGKLIAGDDEAARGVGEGITRAEEVKNSTGLQQLYPRNTVLVALNTALASHVREIEFVNISSLDDEVVPTESSGWPFGWNLTLEGFKHFDLKNVPAGSDYANALGVAYGEVPIKGLGGG